VFAIAETTASESELKGPISESELKENGLEGKV
jgi:hypothetical protein